MFRSGAAPTTTAQVPPRKGGSLSWSLRLLRILTLECVPVLVLFGLFLATLLFRHLHDEYLIPLMPLINFNIDREPTYYHRLCTKEDLSTTDSYDLVMDDNMSSDDAVANILKHGATVFPDLLSPETIQEVRNYIVEGNKVIPNIEYAIAAENRHTWGLLTDTPVIAKMMKELFSNKRFKDTLFKIAGDDPVVLEFNHITAKYGAKQQYIHSDITYGTPLRFARNYIPHYSFFLPLQNTTAGMGASRVCPGSHVCSDGHLHYCQLDGYQLFSDYEHWPAGYAMLYDQQLTHNGAAYTDPHAPLDRVMLIFTFTPRPRYSPKTLETRFIADGGADFNDWSQWGHAFNDYGDANRRMREPWKILRSLGVFKMPGTNWGWDYIQQSLGRISNNQPGWQRHDYTIFRERGGFNWLPQFLHGDVPDSVTSNRMAWSTFALSSLRKCRDFFWKCDAVYVAVYLVLITFGVLLRVGQEPGSKRTFRPFRNAFFRIVLLHAFMLLVAKLIQLRIPKGMWGKHVKKGSLYQVTEQRGLYDLKATMPNKNDILIPDDFQSEYLNAISRFIDVAHPGNEQFLIDVKQNAMNFHKLSNDLKTRLTADFDYWMKQDSRRILAKTINGDWGKTIPEVSRHFIHKELSKASNPCLGFILKWTDYLLSETKYGYWRDTDLHLTFIPQLLRSIQDRLMAYEPKFERRLVNSDDSPLKLPGFYPSSGLPPVPSAPTFAHEHSLNTGVPPVLPITEPFVGAWVEVGDIVEAKFGSDTYAWFRGEVTDVSALHGLWAVQYDDGDSDNSLCARCVRTYVPYKVGDIVHWTNEEDDLDYPCSIIRVHSSSEFDIIVLETKKVLKNVPHGDLHRYEPEEEEIVVGSYVLIDEDSDDTFGTEGVVVAVREDGGYDVLDTSSDLFEDLPPEDVKLDHHFYKA